MQWELDISAANLDLLNSRSRVRSAAKKGPHMDEAAFRVFYAETARSLFGYLLRVAGERSIAEDLTQEAYCRLLSADLSAVDPAKCRSYLFRIATNLLHDRWRQRKKDSLPEDLIEMQTSGPMLDSNLEVRRAFDQLTSREQELLWLAYIEGSSHNEIAECTGLRAASVRTLLFRARRRLADLIRKGG